MLDMHEDAATWLKFASLCRKSGRVAQSEQTLVRLLDDIRRDAEARGLAPFDPGNREPDVMYAWFKHLWATGVRQEAFAGVQHLAQARAPAAVAAAAAFGRRRRLFACGASWSGRRAWLRDRPPAGGRGGSPRAGLPTSPPPPPPSPPQELANVALAAAAGGGAPDPSRLLLSAKVQLKLGLWRRALTEELSDAAIATVVGSLRAATECAPGWGKAWHHWAYFNCEAMVRPWRRLSPPPPHSFRFGGAGDGGASPGGRGRSGASGGAARTACAEGMQAQRRGGGTRLLCGLLHPPPTHAHTTTTHQSTPHTGLLLQD